MAWKFKEISCCFIWSECRYFEANTGGLVYNATGAFRTGTKDYWNSSTYNDGGKVFWWFICKVPLPIAGQPETRDEEGNITKYYYAVQTKIRNLFTDVSAVASDGSLTKISTSGTNLLKFQLLHQKELIL